MRTVTGMETGGREHVLTPWIPIDIPIFHIQSLHYLHFHSRGNCGISKVVI